MVEKDQIIYDLNIQNILEDWKPEDAIREFISNALDETKLSHTKQEPNIFKDSDGLWHIRDYGRGLKPNSFIQNENEEKLNRNDMIGKFGIGLKDAIATLVRNKISFYILADQERYEAEYRIKAGGSNELTIHMVASPLPKGQKIQGTDVVMRCTDQQIQNAKGKFSQYDSMKVLASTDLGEIIQKPFFGPAKIYFNGLEIAQEENFIFSYNITKPTLQLKKALNRERKNVGKTAYAKRIQDMYKNLEEKAVMDILLDHIIDRDFSQSELDYSEVMASVLQWSAQDSQTNRDKVFVSQSFMENHPSMIADVSERQDKKIVILPDTSYKKIETFNKNTQDSSTSAYGQNTINTFDQILRIEEENFNPEVISFSDLAEKEQKVFKLAQNIVDKVSQPHYFKAIKVAQSLYSYEEGAQAVGLWDSREQTIYIRRDQLNSSSAFLGTLIHEIIHAQTGKYDATRAFESFLTQVIGQLASGLVDPNASISIL